MQVGRHTPLITPFSTDFHYVVAHTGRDIDVNEEQIGLELRFSCLRSLSAGINTMPSK